MKLNKIIALTLGLSMTFSSLAYAGTWEQIGTDWKYKNDDGTYAANGWQWIDDKSYYFDANGIMAKSTTVDGYTVNADGQWVVDDVVQTQTTNTNTSTATSVNYNANYDPAHPLAGKIDEWNLRLPYNVIGANYIYSENVQAMLTGQMDQYYIPPVGESTNPRTGTKIYTRQEEYDAAVANEQAIYNWFCNWLNGMDFEHMSEMDRAKEIQKVLETASYEYGAESRDPYYSVLINKKGYCG